MISTMRPGRLPAGKRPPWRQQLVDAESGLKLSFRADGTLMGYGFALLAVLAGGTVAELQPSDWAVVVLAVTAVLASQLFRQMLLRFVEQVDEGMAIDTRPVRQMGTAAVVITNVGAFLAASLIIGQRLMESWWG